MIEASLILITIMQLLILAAFVSYIVWRLRWRIDAGRIAGVMAADLMQTYQDDIGQLSESGVTDYARKRYIELAATFGLPTGPADHIGAQCWRIVANAQGEAQPGEAIRAIYE